MDTQPINNEYENNESQGTVADSYVEAMQNMPDYNAHIEQMRSSNNENGDNVTASSQEQSPEERKKEELRELIKEKGILSREAVDFVYDDMYPAGIPGAKDNVVKYNILEGLINCMGEKAIKEGVDKAYFSAYKKAYRNSETYISKSEEDIARSVSHSINYYHPVSSKFLKQSKRVANRLIDLQCANEVPHVIENMTEDDMAKIKLNAAITTLRQGEFFLQEFKNNPQNIDNVMSELGLDKNDESITLAAVVGYGDKDEAPEASYFDLKNKIAELIYTDSNKFRARGKELLIDIPHSAYKVLGANNSEKALADIKAARSGLIDKLKNNTEFGEIVRASREQKIKAEKSKLFEKITKWNIGDDDIDFEHYLDTKTISVSHTDAVEKYIEDKISEEPLRHFMYAKKVCDLLNISSETEVMMDYTGTIQESLLARLEQGMGIAPTHKEWNGDYGHHSHDGERAEYLTEIFKTESFKKVQARLELDFSDPKVFDKAFNGFINTLKTPNGEYSEQADWYYQNIFSNNPEKFGFMLGKMWRDKDTPQGLKGKITRFKNSNEAFLAYKNNQEENYNSDKIVCREASYDDIKRMIKRRQKELYEQIKKYGIQDVDTFSGQPHLDRTGEGVEHDRRKEAPIDFGIQKVEALWRYYSFIKNNISGAFPSGSDEKDWFIDSFLRKSMDDYDPDDQFANVDLKSKATYLGFSFNYKGKKCVMMESFNNDSAMWAMRLDKEEDFNNLLAYSRIDAIRTEDPRIVQIRHRDVQDPEMSIDGAVQEAFLFFETGDKEKATRYGAHASKDEFKDYLSRNFPDEAIGIDRTEQRNPGSLEGYRNWQTRQIEEQKRLEEAMARGGDDEAWRESERIARENAERLYNKTLANT